MTNFDSQITNHEMSKIYRLALQKKIIDAQDSSVIFFDLTRLIYRLEELKNIFPSNTLHAVAIKTNPLIKILSIIANSGMGLEAASFSEVKLAQYVKTAPGKIVFNSPAKTAEELKYALNTGVSVNVDNLTELKRIVCINSETEKKNVTLRINPQIGEGKIRSMSTGGIYSKFGTPIRYRKSEIIEAFKSNKWLNGLHVHSGSQGLGIAMLVQGIKVVHEFALELNRILKKHNCPNRVERINIGGGFPVAYHENEEQLKMEEYVSELEKQCPSIFTDFQVITEFGRYVHAQNGWVASRVEYVNPHPQIETAIIHVGADLFLRECYSPEDWYHKISLLDYEGKVKESTTKNQLKSYNIAGPLCFEGDVIRRDVLLPAVNSDDVILIHDTGANTLNLWSRHCSRKFPKVVGYYTKENVEFEILKERETIEDIIQFWL